MALDNTVKKQTYHILFYHKNQKNMLEKEKEE